MSELEAYQAIICLGKHGCGQSREALFVRHFTSQRPFVLQRAILIAIQELITDVRARFYRRAVEVNSDHTQLVSFLSDLDRPNYGVRLRPQRRLPAEPRVVSSTVKRGVGMISGRVVNYRISRHDYDYE